MYMLDKRLLLSLFLIKTSLKLKLALYKGTTVLVKLRLSMRVILGAGMSAEMWEVTVDHARTCTIDPGFYFYCPGSQQKSGVVFNAVRQVMRLLPECQYSPIDKLFETEKAFFNHLGLISFFIYCFDEGSVSCWT
ncbi:hypothetical protein TEA_023058 [Camellia sinensis var. sinensis]|uniref:Uncharacterized protein n=1 Tax=Camellia sinensis var. sinensis TaxID=542762 RepID=A0A4S4ENL9_CAMSN|nr:hypothetical protein TEA_023058 [Camellia sinensis var. sinensis]